jgi:hypothetical protein
MNQRHFEMVKTNGVTLRTVLEGKDRWSCCCMDFLNVGISGAIR